MNDPERDLALRYATSDGRDALAALLALDDALAQVLRTTREPIVGQMRLTWWHEALTHLDVAPPPAEPVLRDLHRLVVLTGVSGARLARLVEGWESLLDGETLDLTQIEAHAMFRGTGLFEIAGTVLNAKPSDPLAAAGRGWALGDLARHVGDRAIAARARALAAAALAPIATARWSRAARPLGALALIARMNLTVPLDTPLPVGAPGRVVRMLRLRLTGR